jgi:asparagine synthetase B (glutamine-hydrolysing)
MCGIHAAISKAVLDRIDAKLEKCLRNRGPDHLGTVDVRLDKDGSSLHVALTATVLALRGDHVAAQPLVDDDSGSVLCWNGEAWKIRGEPVQGNDGKAVLALLSAASKLGSTEAILDVMRSIEGPFAFLYLDKPSGVLYYGRDRLGRRSLLVHSSGDTLQLSSIAQSSCTGWLEVEADGCYTLSLDPSNFEIAGPSTRHDWVKDDSMVSNAVCDVSYQANNAKVSSIGVFNSTILEAPLALTDQAESVQDLRHHLVESLRLRVLDVPVPPSASKSDARVAVLFSGGLDCTVLASLASDLVPKDQSIDLLNVAFENPRIAAQHKDLGREELYEMCPDRITGRKSFAELIATAPERSWRLVTVR